MLQLLGASLVAMALISVAVFERATRGGGVSFSSSGEHVRVMKGDEYEVTLSLEPRGGGWVGSTPTSFSVETGELERVEPLRDGTAVRLKFLGRYAGRSEGVEVGVSLTDPLRLFQKLEHVVRTEHVLDTMPLSLLAPEVERRLKVIGYGEQSTGYAGQGQELYKLDEYSPGYTKDIVWRRVAESSEEALVARVREANVRDVLRVGVVRFAERGREESAAWTDLLCEAIGEVGREVLHSGAGLVILFHRGQHGESKRASEEKLRGVTSVEAADIDELAGAVMSCSLAAESRDVASVVAESDLVVTGLRELEDESAAMALAQRPLLLIYDKVSHPLPLAERSVIWTGREDLLPLVRKTLEG